MRNPKKTFYISGYTGMAAILYFGHFVCLYNIIYSDTYSIVRAGSEYGKVVISTKRN